MTRDDEVNLELLRNELARVNGELAELRQQLQRERQARGSPTKTFCEIRPHPLMETPEARERGIAPSQILKGDEHEFPAGEWVRRFQAQMKFCPNGNKTRGIQS